MSALYQFFFFFFFFFSPHLPDSHPSYPPSMCVKREPHEASFAPFTPSSVGDSALADILPHQSSLSVDASTPSYLAHAHSSCYSQYASQPFIAGTTFPTRPRNRIIIQMVSLFILCSLLVSVLSYVQIDVDASPVALFGPCSCVHRSKVERLALIKSRRSLPFLSVLCSAFDPLLVSHCHSRLSGPYSLMTGPKCRGPQEAKTGGFKGADIG